jgi:hypothetical protein
MPTKIGAVTYEIPLYERIYEGTINWEVIVFWVAPLSKLGYIGISLLPDQNMVHGTHFATHLLLWVTLHYSFPKSSMEAKKIEN